jgi:hypothetical protein
MLSLMNQSQDKLPTLIGPAKQEKKRKIMRVIIIP